jgi:hypothetical protein
MFMKRMRILMLVVLLALAITPVAFADETTVVVSPSNMNGWAFLQEGPTGSGTLVDGPIAPPLGTGSVSLTVDSTGRYIIATQAHGGIRLADLITLKYSTYQPGPSTTVAISLQFNLDENLTDSNELFQGRLVYEP